MVGFVDPMLAQAGDPPLGDGWCFEFKWDGIRAVAVTDGGVTLWSRGGLDITRGFPELAVLTGLGRSVVLDGEVVVLDTDGRPDFGLLQQRWNINKAEPRFTTGGQVCYMVFDLLALDGEDLLGESYERRRELLAGLQVDGPVVRVSPFFTGVSGTMMLGVARAHGLEGIVAKRLDSRYAPGERTNSWVKTVLWATQEVVVCGWRPGDTPATRALGALLLGAYDGAGRLRYVGDVSAGFTDAMRLDISDRLTGARAASGAPFTDRVRPRNARGARWVYPTLVGEVQCRTVSRHGRLRYASWRGWRPDRNPREAVI